MKKLAILLSISLMLVLTQCKNKEEMKDDSKETTEHFIKAPIIEKVISELQANLGEENSFRIEKGVNQVAALWFEKDGTIEDFEKFCSENFVKDETELDVLFTKLSRNFEILWGNFHKMSMELSEPLDMPLGEINDIDMLFGSYSPSSHLDEDFYSNKIAFITALNFPFYSLKEKSEMGKEWTSKQWAYARMGDVYTSRIPAEILQKASETYTNADTYISEYNIIMGNLIDADKATYFPEDMKLITHWGLRDELKSNYSGENGLIKQKMIYQVMKRIIDQSIPQMVINNPEYKWEPYENKVYKDNNLVEFTSEPDTRYQHLLNAFHSMQAIDKYSPQYPNYIQRKFEGDMEISQEDVEKLFVEFVSSPQVKEVAALISKRLGRKLQPFDIWYDGFKARGSMNEEELDKITQKKYPTAKDFEADFPNLLAKLQFTPEQASFISSKVRVDAARGSGHAAGAEMKSDKARLRTRVAETGMNYKGYNIACHEFGHNVEQTITLQNVDYYMINGVPNTAFTEALAFIFQKRDLELLGLKEENSNKKHLMALDNFWSCYEIMGVSLVDMNVWKWLYEHPEATAAELKEAVITIAKDVWNKYYADVFGAKDEPILAIYSHMIDNPLYLSAYPIGHLIDFQIEQQIEGKNFAEEVYRIYTQGRLIPQVWMKNSVGNEISNEPTLKATTEALKLIVE
ncbi:MAG: hypothetical protein K9J13_06575 [Saprospiraceae bacterium]|nr:hypothetical protein [Saprospiraceae bacterium]